MTASEVRRRVSEGLSDEVVAFLIRAERAAPGSVEGFIGGFNRTSVQALAPFQEAFADLERQRPSKLRARSKRT
ncbi:MAG: hypothetical protein ACJ8GN_02050 [Longimicrobiaceae bacterium]